MNSIKVPISFGELVDKITILEIKFDAFSGDKRSNCSKELNELKKIANSLPVNIDVKFYKELLLINSELWRIEDQIRSFEKKGIFNDEFVKLARSVYFTNDKRSEIKRKINTQYNSSFIEEKSYSKY